MVNCENCKKYEDCKSGSGLTWPCGAYTPKHELNCIKCHYIHPENGNCTALGGFYTAVPATYCPLIPELLARAEAAEARAEKAERERDAAVADLRLVSDCRTCGNVSPWCIDNPDKCKGWEWRGRKEE